MMTKRGFSSIFAAAFLLVGSGRVLAQEPIRPIWMMRYRLGLTDQQVSEIQGLLRKHRDAVFPLTQELRAKKHALAKALEAPQPDPTAIGKLTVEQRSLRKQIAELSEKLRTDINAVLTPEQKQKLEQWQPFRGPLMRPMPNRQRLLRRLWAPRRLRPPLL